MKKGTPYAWAGLALAAAVLSLWILLTMQVAIPENRSVFVIAFFSAAALGVTAFVRGVSWVSGPAAGLAVVIGLFVPFTIGVSRQEVATASIQVGDVIPAFTGLDEHGETFDSAALDGHLVLIKFFRAHW